MNIQNLIMHISKKPEMFVGVPKIEALYQFVSGYLFCNIVNQRADYVDYEFKKNFHVWVKNYIEKEKNILLPEQRNWLYYILESYEESEQLDTFFKLCSLFFEQIVFEQKPIN